MKCYLLLLFTCCAFFVFGQNEHKYEAFVDSLIKTGQKEKLIPYFQKELKSNPKDEMILRWLGHLYIENNQLDLGERYYRDALVINPKCSMCYVNIGKIFLQKNDDKKAFEYYDKAISLDPKNFQAYAIRAQLNERVGNKFAALNDYNKTIELDPENAFNYLQRAEFNFRQGYSSVALSDINKAIELSPDYSFCYFKRSSVYYEKRMIQEALQDIGKAINLDSTQHEFYSGRGAIYASMKEHKKAIDDYSKAIQLHPIDYFSYYNRALDTYALEDMDGSCDDLHTSATLLEKYAPTDELKAEIDYSIGNYCDSTKASYYYQRGIAFYNLKQYDKAILIYSKGLKKFPNNSMTLSFRGNSYLAMKDYASALIDYSESIKNKENLLEDIKANQKHTALINKPLDKYANAFIASMQISIAESKFALGQYEEALTEINKGIEMAPDIKEYGKDNYYNVRGNIYLALHKFQLALNDFDKSIQLNRDFALAYVNRAIAKVNLNSKTPITFNSFTGVTNSQTFNVNWQLPIKSSLKKNDSNVISALQDCDKAIELDEKLAYAYYIRGQIKKMLSFTDYCYDLIKAKEHGYAVENELLEKCLDTK